MVDTCVICGQPVPEGTQVCPICIEKSQTAKADAGKIRPTLVPVSLVLAVAAIRGYGTMRRQTFWAMARKLIKDGDPNV